MLRTEKTTIKEKFPLSSTASVNYEHHSLVMREIITALKAIKDNDRTPAYNYSLKSKNREGKMPKQGQRWLTPYEIAQQELQRLGEG